MNIAPLEHDAVKYRSVCSAYRGWNRSYSEFLTRRWHGVVAIAERRVVRLHIRHCRCAG